MNLAKKLAYSFGAVATALSYQAFSTYIIFFYVDVQKLPAAWAAAGMLIFAVWNAINDPLFGFLSDRTRTPWGRRIPYILLGAVPFGLVYFLLWVPPSDGIVSLLIYYIIIICIFDAFYTLCVLNWASLYPEMFPTLSLRSEVNAYRQTFGMIGLMLGISIPPLIYSTLGWGWMGAIFGAVISAALFIALLGSREKKAISAPLPFFEAVRATFTNRSFLSFVFANLCVQYTFTLILATVPFFAKYVLNATPSETSMILFAPFVVAIPSLYVWRKIVVSLGIRTSFIAALLSFLVFLLPLFMAQGFTQVLLIAGLMGIGLAGFILIVDVLISEVIDLDEKNTGRRREGMYFGVNAFITRFAIGLEAASMGAVFLITGYNPAFAVQPESFLWGLRILLSLFPAVAVVLSLFFFSFYPATSAQKIL